MTLHNDPNAALGVVLIPRVKKSIDRFGFILHTQKGLCFSPVNWADPIIKP